MESYALRIQIANLTVATTESVCRAAHRICLSTKKFLAAKIVHLGLVLIVGAEARK